MVKREKGTLKSDGHLRKTDGKLSEGIGRRVKAFREMAGWSQGELERRADLGVGVVSRIEGTAARASRFLSIDVVDRLCQALQVPIELLVYGKILKHAAQLSLLSPDGAAPVWAMAPGGTRQARLRAKGQRGRPIVMPPRGTLDPPPKPPRRKPKAKPGQ